MVLSNVPDSKVSVADMVEALSKFDRYKSAVCFSDDVLETLCLANRIKHDINLKQICPGQYEFALEDGSGGTIFIRKPGITEAVSGVGHNRRVDQCPVPILSVKRSESIKESLVHDVFLLLKDGDKKPGRCFLIHRYLDNWEFYHGGLVRWAKRRLWP